MQRGSCHVKVPLARNRGSSEGQESDVIDYFKRMATSDMSAGNGKCNAIHKVRIVCGRVASPGVHCSRRFDNPVSLTCTLMFSQ